MSDPSEGGVLFVITASMIREIEEALSTRPFSSIRAAKWSTVPNLGNPRLSNLTFRAKLFILIFDLRIFGHNISYWRYEKNVHIKAKGV